MIAGRHRCRLQERRRSCSARTMRAASTRKKQLPRVSNHGVRRCGPNARSCAYSGGTIFVGTGMRTSTRCRRNKDGKRSRHDRASGLRHSEWRRFRDERVCREINRGPLRQDRVQIEGRSPSVVTTSFPCNITVKSSDSGLRHAECRSRTLQICDRAIRQHDWRMRPDCSVEVSRAACVILGFDWHDDA